MNCLSVYEDLNNFCNLFAAFHHIVCVIVLTHASSLFTIKLSKDKYFVSYKMKILRNTGPSYEQTNILICN
jgi:hypothetical protein